MEGREERGLCACATSVLPAASVQDGGVGLSAFSCLREHEGLCAAVFQVTRRASRACAGVLLSQDGSSLGFGVPWRSEAPSTVSEAWRSQGEEAP